MALCSLSCSYIVLIRTSPKQGLDQWLLSLLPPYVWDVREGFPQSVRLLSPLAPAQQIPCFPPQALPSQEFLREFAQPGLAAFLRQEACPVAMAVLGRGWLARMRRVRVVAGGNHNWHSMPFSSLPERLRVPLFQPVWLRERYAI